MSGDQIAIDQSSQREPYEPTYFQTHDLIGYQDLNNGSYGQNIVYFDTGNNTLSPDLLFNYGESFTAKRILVQGTVGTQASYPIFCCPKAFGHQQTAQVLLGQKQINNVGSYLGLYNHLQNLMQWSSEHEKNLGSWFLWTRQLPECQWVNQQLSAHKLVRNESNYFLQSSSNIQATNNLNGSAYLPAKWNEGLFRRACYTSGVGLISSYSGQTGTCIQPNLTSSSNYVNQYMYTTGTGAAMSLCQYTVIQKLGHYSSCFDNIGLGNARVQINDYVQHLTNGSSSQSACSAGAWCCPIMFENGSISAQSLSALATSVVSPCWLYMKTVIPTPEQRAQMEETRLIIYRDLQVQTFTNLAAQNWSQLITSGIPNLTRIFAMVFANAASMNTALGAIAPQFAWSMSECEQNTPCFGISLGNSFQVLVGNKPMWSQPIQYAGTQGYALLGMPSLLQGALDPVIATGGTQLSSQAFFISNGALVLDFTKSGVIDRKEASNSSIIFNATLTAPSNAGAQDTTITMDIVVLLEFERIIKMLPGGQVEIVL